MSQVGQVYENIPQYYFNVVRPRIACLLFGRGTGKTTGPIADRIYDVWSTMPRSHSIIIVPSYQKFLTQMIPGLRKGLGKFNLRNGAHYTYGRFFEEKKGVLKPYIFPEKPVNFMHCINGSGTSIVSLDRPETMGNGLDSDAIIIDEGKLCEYDDIKEVLPTLRGNSDIFGNLHIHQSLLVCSDKPTNSKGAWLYNYKDMHTPKKINDICTLVMDILPTLYTKLQEAKRPSAKFMATNAIKQVERDLAKLRREAIMYLEASSIDNVYNLGIDFIYAQKNLLSDLDFSVSILGETVIDTKDGFYWALNSDEHGYEAPNYSHIDQLVLQHGEENLPERNMAWDMDVNTNLPLDIALDYNNAINSLVVGQSHGNTYRLINTMFALKEDREHLEHLIEKFCKYYEHKTNRQINYYYDQTAINENAQGSTTNKDLVCQILRKRGFHVNEIYLGRNSSYLNRYILCERLFTGKNNNGILFQYNKTNCEDWYIAMKQARTKQGKTGFEKDKSSERDPNTKPQHATHLTEATDTLLVGALSSYFQKELEFDDIKTK